MPVINNNFRVLLAKKSAADEHTITIDEVSKITGVSRRTISAWINNKVKRFDVNTIVSLCDYLQVNLSDLVEYKPASNSNSQPPA